MSDFSHLADLEEATETARYDFPHIKGEPWLDVKQANDNNRAYYNGLLRYQRRSSRRRGRTITVQDVAENREQDRLLYARHVVVKWGNVRDRGGEEVALSEDACREFLQAIPNVDMDELRDFAATPHSFSKDAVPDEDLAKN